MDETTSGQAPVPAKQGGGILSALEGPWYSLLDFLDSKGVPVYKVIDPIDEKVPSVLVAIAVLLLIIGGIAFLFLGGGGAQITIKASADGRALDSVQVSAYAGETLVDSGETGSDGIVELSLPRGTVRLELSRENCEDRELEIEVDGDGEREIDMECLTSAIFGGCLELPETLSTARIVGEDNIEPSNCRLSATTPDGREVDTQWVIDSTNRLMFSTEKCVQDDYEIFIDCDWHSRRATADEIVSEARISGEVLVHASGTGGLKAETLYNVYVTVENRDGQGLANIRVLAIDTLGNEYITGYRNTKTSDVTNIDGSAVLKIAEGLEFMVRAEDLNQVYAPATSSLLKADDSMEVLLKMDDGLQSTIRVTGSGSPLAGAPIMVKQGGVTLVKANADASGQKTVSLDSGTYSAESAPRGYYPGSTQFSAGEAADIDLAEVVEGDEGIIKIIVLAPDTMPLQNARVLLTWGDITAGDCITGDSGKCVFEGMAPGQYGLSAVAPATPSPQEFEGFELAAGGVVEKTITVQPKGFVLAVRAKTLTEFLSGATVRLLSRATGEKLDEKQTGADGKAEFEVYLSQSIYLEGEYRDYPPASSSSILVTGDTEAYLMFSTPDPVGGESVVMDAPDSMLPGGTAQATVSSLGARKQYAATVIEVWSGEQGSKDHPINTPVELGEVMGPSGSTVKASDVYSGGEPPIKEEPGTSKYIRYSAPGGTHTVTIPLIAKAEARGSTTLHYRARWETTGGEKIQGGWQETQVTLTGGTEWTELINAYFSSYKAGFGAYDAPEGMWSESALLMPGEQLYVHVLAMPKKNSKTFTIKLDSRPPSSGAKHIRPIEYEAGGETKAMSPSLPQTASLQYEIREGEPVHIIMKMAAMSAVKEATLEFFNNRKSPLTFTVDGSQGLNPEDIEFDTPIPGVKAAIVPKALVCPPAGYPGGCNWGRFLPLDTLGSLSQEGPREIDVEIEFRNQGEADQTFTMGVNAPGISGLNYWQEIAVGSGVSVKAPITGTGKAPGQIAITLDDQGWQYITHGLVDYAIETMGNTGDLRPDSAELRVRPLRNGALMEDAEVNAEGKALVLRDGGYFSSEGLELDLTRSSIPVSARHREFVELFSIAPIKGIFFEPEEKDYRKPSLVLDDLHPVLSKKIVTVINNNDAPASLVLSPSLQEEHLDISVEAVMLNDKWEEVPGHVIPAYGRAEVYLTAAAESIECNQQTSNNTIKVTASGGGMTKSGTYFADVTCDLTRGPGAGDYVVFRESGEIKRGSCQLIGDTAYLCDAEQLSKALLLAAENLHDSDKDTERHVYAFGNDFVNAKVVDETGKTMSLSYPGTVGGRGEESDNALIVPDIKCGLIEAVFRKGSMGRMELTAKKTDAPWCSPSSQYYFAGAMNTNPGIPFAKDLTKTMAATEDSEQDTFLGHGLGTNDEAVFTVEYRELSKSDVKGLGFAKYKWLKEREELLRGGTGYFAMAPIRDGADFFVGTVDGNANCFLANMEHHWATGANTYILKNARGGVVLAGLAACEAPPAIVVPGVSVRVDDSIGSDVHTTRDTDVDVHVTSSGRDCILVMEDKAGNQLRREALGSSVVNWELPAEDYVLFKASCRDTAYAKWATTFLVKDTEPPSVTIPALTAIQDDSVIFTAVAEDRYGVDYCLLELDAVGSKTFPARECVTTDNENFDCDSRTQFNSPEPTGLPKDRYTLLRFNVTCFDFNGNDGVARGAVYYYPEGVPIITVDTVNTPVTLVDEVYYYTKVGQPDLYIDASSTVGLTGCGIGGRNCLEVDCKSDGHGCYEAKYNCQGVTLSHGHNIIDVACVEFAAEGEVPQQLTAPFDFVYDEAPPVVTITPAKYDVTACTPATPRINITFTDSWFDDQEVDAARTTCTMALFKDVGGVRAETPMAHGYGDTLEASQPGEYTFESTLARAVDIANAISVTADGQADGDNVVVKCETTIHKTGDTGTETVGKMEANLKGMVPYDNVGTVLGGSAGKPVPVYLLPPGVAEATSMVERLGAYCYNNAYNASAKSADDDQACYYVDFSLLQGEISGDSLSVSLSDRGDVVKRGLGIGGSPTDCAGGSGDCAFKQKYSTGMRELMWFEDTGHVATDYPLERRHENNLHLGSGFSGETWPKYQRGIVTGKECGAVEALPNTDPDYDDLINPKALSFTAPEGEVFRGDTLEGLVCEGKDTEDNTLNAWISYTPESETSYLSMLAPHDGHPTPLPLRLALVDGMMATMAGEPFSFTPELTAAKGNYMLSCRIEDQDFMVSTTEASLPIKVKNNLPYVTSLAADPNPVYRTEATEVVCVGEDKEDLLTGASLKAAEIKYKRPTGTTPEKTWLGAAKYEADKGGYVASLTVPKDMGVGDYDLHCRLQDSEGDWGEWYEAIGALTVENIPPVINDIIYPEVILLDEPGTYDVNATDDDSSLTYAWDFGDTGTAKTKEASHSYTSTGKKTLSITVTDDQDASVTKTVEIYVMKEASGMGCYAACRYFDVGSTVTLSSPLKVRYSTGSDPGDTDTLRIDVASGCTATEMGADEVWQDMGKDDARKDNGQWEHCACGLGLKLTCGNGGAKCSYPMEGYTDCDWNFVTSISTVSTKGSAMDPPQPTLFWGRFKEDVSTGSQSFRYIRACAPAACLDYMSIAIAADISYTEVDADTTPPSFNGIEKLEVSYSFGTVSRIDLTWKAATDAHPPIKYIIYEKIGDGGYTEAGKTSILSYSEKYPDCDDGCSYKVLAMDKYGNKGSLADAEAKSVSATKEGLLGLGKWCWSNDACASGFCDFTVGVGTSYGECLCDEDSDCPDDYPYCGTAGDENECVKISCEAYAIDYIARHLPENPASYGFTCKGSSDSSYDYCFSGVGECSWPSRYCCWNV